VEVMAANDAGAWSERPLQHRFTVKPAWWLRWYTLGAVLLVLMLIYVTLRKQAREARRQRDVADEHFRKAEEQRLLAEHHAADANEQRLIVKEMGEEKLARFEDLVGGIAHELNTPLGSILSGNDFIRRVLGKLDEDALGEDNQRLLTKLPPKIEITAEAGERIASVLQSLRHFVRLDESEMQLERPAKLIKDSLAVTEHRMRNILRVESSMTSEGRMWCYPGKLNQALLVLLEHIREVVSGASLDDPFLEICVEDVAVPGRLPEIRVSFVYACPKEMVEHFDADLAVGFAAQGERVSSSLGLAFAKTVVEEQGGTIEVVRDVEASTLTFDLRFARSD